MEIKVHPPAEKGVTTLMYVGDDAVDGAAQRPSGWIVAAGLALAAWLLLPRPRRRRRR